MGVFIVSDMHLFDRDALFLFNKRKEEHFEKLCELVLQTDSRLLCAGDIFDFTGMETCPKNAREFFEEAVPFKYYDQKVVDRISVRRTQPEMLRAIHKVFPRFFASLGKIAQAQKLDFIPGNHDCELLDPKLQNEFARLLDVSSDAINWGREFIYGDGRVIVRHGNEFDPSNRTNKSCENPGEVFTSALYQCVIPALRMMGVAERTLEAIPAVRPEEATLIWIDKHIGKEQTKTILAALVRLLERNGFFHGLGRIPGWFLVRSVPLVSRAIRKGITVERVRGVLPKDSQLKLNARAGAKIVRDLAVKEARARKDATVVMGHTHVLDVHHDYVNLGTWIDHITGLSEEHLAHADFTLPVFYFEEKQGWRFFDMEDVAKGKSIDESLIMPASRKKGRP